GVIPHVEGTGRAGTDSDREDREQANERIDRRLRRDEPDEGRENDEGHHPRPQQHNVVSRTCPRHVQASDLNTTDINHRPADAVPSFRFGETAGYPGGSRFSVGCRLLDLRQLFPLVVWRRRRKLPLEGRCTLTPWVCTGLTLLRERLEYTVEEDQDADTRN